MKFIKVEDKYSCRFWTLDHSMWTCDRIGGPTICKGPKHKDCPLEEMPSSIRDILPMLKKKNKQIEELGEAGEHLTSLAFCLIEHIDSKEPACASCKKMMKILYKIEERKDAPNPKPRTQSDVTLTASESGLYVQNPKPKKVE